MINRVILIVLDSVGIGELPDAYKYNDIGSNTIGNIAKKTDGFSLKNLQMLGLANISDIHNLKPVDKPRGCFGKALEKSPGKDTTTGHWEISGLILNKPFPTFKDAFPNDLILQIEKAIGIKTIGNEIASGTEIIKRLGDEHVKTGSPIIYTSADSVFQIAAHENVIPIEKLYEFCTTIRKILKDDYAVARVIARPFIGQSGNYNRTSNRRDFSIKPLDRTMLDIIKDNEKDVIAVGKIEDIFAGIGVTKAIHTKDNMDGIDSTIECIKNKSNGLIFTNLVDFDMLYGHRNDVEGYAKALYDFDCRLKEIIDCMKDDDILIITADHGCDPTTISTDHSREYIPILFYGNKLKQGINIGIRECFCDIGATILDILELPIEIKGTSFKNSIIEEDLNDK